MNRLPSLVSLIRPAPVVHSGRVALTPFTPPCGAYVMRETRVIRLPFGSYLSPVIHPWSGRCLLSISIRSVRFRSPHGSLHLRNGTYGTRWKGERHAGGLDNSRSVRSWFTSFTFHSLHSSSSSPVVFRPEGTALRAIRRDGRRMEVIIIYLFVFCSYRNY